MNQFLDSLSPDALTAFWTITVAIVCSVMCALLGVWLVLQRMSMLGDAISHSVLPGLVLTFIFFGTRASLPMFLGAAVAGVLTVVLTRLIGKASLLREDASMGVVFTVLFALGVFLITRYTDQIDLDPGCVLYGLIEFVSLDTTKFAGADVPRALVTLFPALILSGLFLLLFRKELLAMSFDSELARTLGKKPDAIYFALMSMVAIATVASFEAVGSILVIAMLIGPASAAQLLTRRLRPMFAIATVLAIVSSVVGYYTAVLWNTSIAGMMSVTIGVCYALAVILSPSGGVLYRKLQQHSRIRAIQEEDILAAVYRLRESGQTASLAEVKSLIGEAWYEPAALDRLKQGGKLLQTGDGWELSSAGLKSAGTLVRRHRLLESYFVSELLKEAGEVHERAHRSEHFLGEAGEKAVEEALGPRAVDPHGKTIPPSEGR